MSPALRSLLAQSARWASHPLADQALTEVKALVGAYVARQHAPHRWALFHRRMATTLPRWRVLARASHRSLARRYAAHAWAMDQQAAERCGLAER